MSSFVVFLLLLPIWSVPTGDGLNLNHSNHTKQDDLLKSEDDSQFAKLEDLIGTFSKKALDLSQCYNPKIGEKQVNIFTTKFSEVLQHYQETYPDLFKAPNTDRRVQIFTENVYNLVKLIINCTSKATTKQTQYGLTRLSAFSNEEYQLMIGARSSTGKSKSEQGKVPQNQPKNTGCILLALRVLSHIWNFFKPKKYYYPPYPNSYDDGECCDYSYNTYCNGCPSCDGCINYGIIPNDNNNNFNYDQRNQYNTYCNGCPTCDGCINYGRIPYDNNNNFNYDQRNQYNCNGCPTCDGCNNYGMGEYIDNNNFNNDPRNQPYPYNNNDQRNQPYPYNNNDQRNQPYPYNNNDQRNQPYPYNNNDQRNQPYSYNNNDQRNQPYSYNNNDQRNQPYPYNNNPRNQPNSNNDNNGRWNQDNNNENDISGQDCDVFFYSEYEIPCNFDWREQGLVTPVKYQGNCSSSFVFAGTAAVEGAFLRKATTTALEGTREDSTGSSPVDFNNNAVVNCLDMSEDACAGGLKDEKWETMTKQDMVDASYQDEINQCRDLLQTVEIDGYCNSFSVTSQQLQQLVLQRGPIVVGIDMGHFGFQHLLGSYNDDECTCEINHSALLVGWTEQYWIVKNSWGTDWGLDGYLYLDRSEKNKCGINSQIGAVWLK